MPFVDTLRLWDAAVTAADRQDLAEALQIFLSIQEPNSKIFFDLGCLQLLHGNLDAAEKAFDCSISKDEHLAVAFFQRGVVFYKQQRYEECRGDFLHAFKALRGNQLIDYKALGLRYKLYACEVLHNAALAEAQLGRWDRAQERLAKALDYKTEAKLGIIDRALRDTLKQKVFKLVEFPSKVLFKPSKHYVAELEKRDYLGKAKVLSSVVPQDAFSGFAPLQPQVENGPTGPKEPEVLRALEGEPHTVLYQFVPETSDELAVVPGNIVFVLQKGSDNWASVIFNERRGLVPYNFLERLEISLDSKQTKGRAEPPSREPPTRPARTRGRTPRSNSGEDAQHQEAEPADGSCVVKVHHTFNFAVSMTPGSPHAALIEKVGKKLNVSPASIILSLTAEGKEQSVIDGNTEMGSVWRQASGGRVTLWCHIKEQPEVKPREELYLVALHSYVSSNPEDLSFQQGDTIKLLSRVNQDWMEGQCNGSFGIFPASFVREAPADEQ